MFKIYDGRKEFYQWDLDQRLIVLDPTVKEVHFCNLTGDCALVCEVYDEGEQRIVNVPNVLLQKNYPIRAYAHCDCATISSQTFNVIPRSKPTDYVYTETEVRRWDEFYKRLDELELGARAIIDVEVLPTEDINSALLYRVPEGVYWYDGAWHKVVDEGELENELNGKQDNIVFDGEYDAETNKAATVQTIVNKVAELIAGAPEDFNTLKELADWLTTHGNEAAKMNSDIKQNAEGIAAINEGLTDYVKYSDEPGNGIAGGKPGPIALNYATSCGLRIEGTAGKRYLTVYPGTDNDWVRRNGRCALVISQLDEYMKMGITGRKIVNGVESLGNQIALTDTEKSSAQKWLGVPSAYEYDNPDMLVDIQFTTAGGSFEIDPDSYAYFVSDKSFTIDELLSRTAPFYMTIKDVGNNTTQTISLADAMISEQEGYIQILKGFYTNNGDWCYSRAYFVYDYTKAQITYGTPPKNGIYFDNCHLHNFRFDRLYRDSKGVKPLDNKYLDLATHSVIKSLLARIEALENK